jgi:CRP/FNR family cyclic AMP-dependent transcriptional regulator
MSSVEALCHQGSDMRLLHRSSMILSRLPPQMTRQLFACAFKRTAKAGEALFVAGDRGDGCYRVDQGLVKITVTSDRGEERIIALVGEGEIIGELSLIDHQPRSASAIALCDSTFRYVTRQAFEDRTKEDPEIYKHLTTILAARLRETDEALAAASFLSVRGCVARTLLELADYIDKDVGRGRILLDQRISVKDHGCHGRGCARERQPRLERYEEARGHQAIFAILPAQRYQNTRARGAPLSVARQGCMDDR